MQTTRILSRQLRVVIGFSLSCLLVGVTNRAAHSAEGGVRPAAATEPAALQSSELLEFDVVIAGGTTAAFAAAIAAAESGARTALLEPTDWVGGQLTASGVPAVDEAWHSIRDPKTGETLLNVAEIARHPANITPNFLSALKAIREPADCWVSRFCFCPDGFHERQLLPLQQHAGERLTVFLNTVVKRAEMSNDGSRIQSLVAIRRRPKSATKFSGYDRLPSKDLPDWYSPADSDRFDKQTLTFKAAKSPEKKTVFIDATEWGEVLALTGAPYLQGVEDSDGGTDADDTCGQSTVFCFVQRFLPQPGREPSRDLPVSNLGYGDYQQRPDAWEKIWTYRRIRGRGKPAPGDLCLQNWGYSAKLGEGGNDYPFGYLFKSRRAAAAERDDWQGGVDLDVMAAAEQRALAWHEWFKNHAPPGIDPQQIVLDSSVLGTGHGLAKLPYIRDTRRSIGLDGFLLRFADLSGPASRRTGTPFADRIAIGAYPADVHSLSACTMPKYIRQAHDTLPFYVPFRALTNERVHNLLVAGKTMAQSFLANSATRLHPTEWSTGTAAGVAAAYMARTRKTSREAYRSISDLQSQVRRWTPIEWTIDGQLVP